jgi:hypothetical protein
LDAIGKRFGFYSHFYPGASKNGEHEYPHRDMMRYLLAREGERVAKMIETQEADARVDTGRMHRNAMRSGLADFVRRVFGCEEGK